MITARQARAAWWAALAALCAALVLFNLPAREEPASPPAGYAADAPLGYGVGERLPDFTLTQTDGAEFSLSACRGRAVVINLWATWCGPCMKELPYFDRLQAAYPDDVAVLAIHSDLVTDDVEKALSGFDYRIAFAVDGDGMVIRALGGSTMLPQTAVLDRYGVVTYNRVGSVSYEALEELVLAAMKEDRATGSNG